MWKEENTTETVRNNIPNMIGVFYPTFYKEGDKWLSKTNYNHNKERTNDFKQKRNRDKDD